MYPDCIRAPRSSESLHARSPLLGERQGSKDSVGSLKAFDQIRYGAEGTAHRHGAARKRLTFHQLTDST